MPGCVRIETTLGQYRRCARQILTNVADISPPPEAIFRLFLRLTERFCGTRDVERLMTRVAVILTLFGRLINRAPNDCRYRFGVE